MDWKVREKEDEDT